MTPKLGLCHLQNSFVLALSPQRSTTRLHLYRDNSMLQGSSHSGEIQTNRQNLNQQLSIIDGELTSIDKEIENLRKLRSTLVTEREEILNKLKDTSTSNRSVQARKGVGGINYHENFEWSEAMKARMKVVFGINSFRLCQEACVPLYSCIIDHNQLITVQSVCNANMDNRDIVCVMPTGNTLIVLNL